jgi:hypothetical protein
MSDEPQIDFNKLIKKVNNIPVEKWKEVESNFYEKGYSSKLLNGYSAIIYRDWKVEHGKPDYTGGFSYGLAVVKKSSSGIPILDIEIAKFQTNNIAELHEKIVETNHRESTRRMIERNKEKRSELSGIISRL